MTLPSPNKAREIKNAFDQKKATLAKEQWDKERLELKRMKAANEKTKELLGRAFEAAAIGKNYLTVYSGKESDDLELMADLLQRQGFILSTVKKIIDKKDDYLESKLHEDYQILRQEYHAQIAKLFELVSNWIEDAKKSRDVDDDEIDEELAQTITNQIQIFTEDLDANDIEKTVREWKLAIYKLSRWSMLDPDLGLTIASLVIDDSEFYSASNAFYTRTQLTPFRLKKIEEFAVGLRVLAKKGLKLSQKAAQILKVLNEIQYLNHDLKVLIWMRQNQKINGQGITANTLSWMSEKSSQEFLDEIRISIEVEARFGGKFIYLEDEPPGGDHIALEDLGVILEKLGFKVAILDSKLKISWD